MREPSSGRSCPSCSRTSSASRPFPSSSTRRTPRGRARRGVGHRRPGQRCSPPAGGGAPRGSARRRDDRALGSGRGRARGGTSARAEGKGGTGPRPQRRRVRSEPSRDAAMGALRAPLLGREAALGRLLDEVERARRVPRRLLVVAPPGVGKTRLVDELAACASGVAVARARLRPDLLAPFVPVTQLFCRRGRATSRCWRRDSVPPAPRARGPLPSSRRWTRSWRRRRKGRPPPTARPASPPGGSARRARG